MLHVKIHSIRNKICEIESFLNVCNPVYDKICFSEHWQSKAEIEVLHITGYCLGSYFCRQTSSHGGVAIYVRQSVVFRQVNVSNYCRDTNCEITCIFTNNLYIITLYRAPKGSVDQFFQALENIFNDFQLISKQVIILGDFNICFYKPNSTGDKLIDLVSSHGLHFVISDCTHYDNCIDNIATNLPKPFVSSVVEMKLSDHKAVNISIQMQPLSNSLPHKSYRPITEVGLNKLYHRVSEIDCAFVDDVILDTNKKIEKFIFILNQEIRRCFPVIIMRTRNKSGSYNLKWFNDELKKMRETLGLLYDMKWRYPHDQAIIDVYRRYRSHYRNKKYCNDKLLKESSNFAKTAWTIINQKRNTQVNQTVSDRITANSNNYFSSIGRDIVNDMELLSDRADPVALMKGNNIPIKNGSFRFTEVTFIGVRNAFNKMKRNNTKDIYDININIIKYIKDLIIIPLTKLINLIIRNGVFPECLKLSKVIPAVCVLFI